MKTSPTLARVAARFRKPNPERLAWEQPLRAQFVFGLLIVSSLAEAALLALEYSEVIQSAFFPWSILESLGLLVVCAWALRAQKIEAAAALLVVSVSHAAAFIIASYGPRSAAPALLLPTIIIAGLVMGGYFLGAWGTICVAILVWVSRASSAWDSQAILFWSAGYAVTAYLVWLFSSHLERLLEAASRAGEERRDAVVAERMRLAREIHDTLAQGFTGVVVQINAAEQIAAGGDPDAWQHLEKARALARRSLDEARQSILLLRSSDLEGSDLLSAIEKVGRNLLIDDSIQLEVAHEGEARELPGEIEAELLRVGQEAVTNAVRHSGANKITVSLRYLPHEVSLRVADNGNGVMEKAPGLGLRGMEERMRQIRGKVTIVAQPAVGTEVCANVAV